MTYVRTLTIWCLFEYINLMETLDIILGYSLETQTNSYEFN